MKKTIIFTLIFMVGLAIFFKDKKIAELEINSKKEAVTKAETSEKPMVVEEKPFSKLEYKLGFDVSLGLDKSFNVKVENLENGLVLPSDFAYCEGKDKDGKNIRPEISWKNAPEGTKSFAVFVIDPDVPTDFTDANKQDKIIPATLARQNFFHFGMVNIPADISKIERGEGRGQAKQQPKFGRLAINDYAAFYEPDANFIGWDGMCPPWNDEKVHRYIFVVYALKVEDIVVGKQFMAKEVFKKIADNAIGYGYQFGMFTRNN
ncbi:MAG: YbhB/YbcL family Raf kinase inhibitor-like protein [Rickettsiales bacterium]|nr:YbhB/YbcL family Raf kinase inhibitor-like protein [Rickettsiales bacterium]